MDLETTDPEAAMVDKSSREAFLRSIYKALAAKQARLSTDPAARMPAGGGQPSPNNPTSKMSGSQTLEYAFSKAFKK